MQLGARRRERRGGSAVYLRVREWWRRVKTSVKELCKARGGRGGGRVLCYRLVTNEVRIEDASGSGGQMRPLAQAGNDCAVHLADPRRDLQKLWANAQHHAQLTKLGPTSTRNQVGEHVGVAVEVGDAKASIKRAPLGGGDKLLVGLHNNCALSGFGREDPRSGERVSVKVDPRGRGLRAKLANVRVKHQHVESGPEELEDRDGKVRDVDRGNRKVPIEAVKVPSHPRSGDVRVARVREQLERHRRENLQVLAEERAFDTDPARVCEQALPAAKLAPHQ
jgi:hypothetical protein